MPEVTRQSCILESQLSKKSPEILHVILLQRKNCRKFGAHVLLQPAGGTTTPPPCPPWISRPHSHLTPAGMTFSGATPCACWNLRSLIQHHILSFISFTVFDTWFIIEHLTLICYNAIPSPQRYFSIKKAVRQLSRLCGNERHPYDPQFM